MPSRICSIFVAALLIARLPVVAANTQFLSAEVPEFLSLQAVSHYGSGNVDCGGHYAETCAVCSQGHGYLWCNGDCTWAWGLCRYTDRFTIFLKSLGDFLGCLYNFFFYRYWILWATPGYMLIVFLYAICYNDKVVSYYPEDKIDDRRDDWESDRRDDWDHRKFGLFAMFGNAQQCMWAIFCTPVLAAKNFHVGKSCGYWPSFCVMLLFYSPFFMIAVVMRAIMSVKLMNNMRIPSSCFGEFLVGLCCLPCAVGRESMEVDDVTYMEVKCLFNAEYNNPWVPDIIEDNRWCCGVCGRDGRKDRGDDHKDRGCCGGGGDDDRGFFHSKKDRRCCGGDDDRGWFGCGDDRRDDHKDRGCCGGDDDRGHHRGCELPSCRLSVGDRGCGS